jgi:hypothetical protein
MVTMRSSGWMLTLFPGLVLAGGMPFWQSRGQAADPPGKTAEQGRLQGRFTAAHTGEPVAGAKVRVRVEGVPGKGKVAEALSGPDGRYTLDVPLGHLSLWGVHAPAGYYTQDPKTFGAMLTTVAEPHAVRDFVLQPGAAWRLELQGVSVPPDQPPLFSAIPNPDPDPAKQWSALGEIIYVTSDARGKGVLTVPAIAGRYRFSCELMSSNYSYEIPFAILESDKDFDPRRIKGVPEPDPEVMGAVRLRDAAGRSAVVEGVEVLVEAGQAVLRFPAQKTPTDEALVLRGAAVDEVGKPIKGARFTAAFFQSNLRPGPGGAAGGAFMTHLEATTDAQGKFELPGVLLPASWFQPLSRMRMLAVKSGFDAANTTKLNLLEVKKAGSADFGTVVLKPGRMLRGKVVDEAGQPVQGAVVRNMTDYFLYSHLACRSDAKGQFVMPDLAFGPQLLSATYGEQFAAQDFAFNATSEECMITLRPKR